MPLLLAVGLDLAFPVALVAVAAREIVVGINWRNLVVLAPVTILGIANLLMHLEANGLSIATGLGWRLALVAVVALISLIGGRIIPGLARYRSVFASVRKPSTPLPIAAITGRLGLKSMLF